MEKEIERKWLDGMYKRNALKMAALRNNHSYTEKFTLDTTGIIMECIIGGLEKGIVDNFYLFVETFSVKMEAVATYYNKHKDSIPKDL